MGLFRWIDFIRFHFSGKKLTGPEFRPEYWLNIHKRKNYVDSILKSQNCKGKSKLEIEAFFGSTECRRSYPNRWTYLIEIKGKKEYVLAFYFEDDLLIDIRYEWEYLH